MLKSFQLSLPLLHIMLIFDTESCTLALFGLFFHIFFIPFLSFYGTDMSKESSRQFPVPHNSLPGMFAPHSTARHSSLFWVSTHLLSCPLFVFWVNEQDGVSPARQDKLLLFCSSDKGWKTTAIHTHAHTHRYI